MDDPTWTFSMCEHTATLLMIAFALWIFLTLALMKRIVVLKRRLKYMPYTDNPLRDFDAWDAEQERQLARLPDCDYCGERIQDEECWCIDGKFICKDCLADCMVLTEDYANEELLSRRFLLHHRHR